MSEYIIERNYDIKNGTFSTVKREEIVRCRDCRYYASNMHECMRLDVWDDSLWFAVEPDDFCSSGEREVEG